MRALNPRASSQVAILLNANAKKVTPRVKARIEQQCEGMDVFYSRSLDEGRLIARQMVESGYQTVLTGGGDGTIVQTINSLFELTGRLPARHASRGDRLLQSVPTPRTALPALGILKLGTGNALAEVVGAKHYEQDVARIRRLMEDGMTPTCITQPLMEAEGQVFPFAGLGWDAAVLNDYNRLKEQASNPVTRAVCKSVLGYLLAALSMTAPQIALEPSPEVEIRALSEATLLGPDGQPVREFNRGAILYRGRMSMVAFATIPFYGYKFQMFPFTSGLSDRFQLRVASPGLPEVLAHLPGLWRGAYRSPRILDFHCQKVTMSFSRPVPFQLAGEAMGTRETLSVGMSHYPIELVDFQTGVQAPSRPTVVARSAMWS